MFSVTSTNKKSQAKNEQYKRISMRFGGAAGDGLQSSGLQFLKFLNQNGYYVQGFPGTQSTIRGGHVWYSIEFSSEELFHFDRPLDILIALNLAALDVHLRDVKERGYLIFNSDVININNYHNEINNRSLYILAIPMTTFAKNINSKTPVLINTVAIGAIIELLGLNIDNYKTTIQRRFLHKEKILEDNIRALISGSNYIKENSSNSIQCSNPPSRNQKYIVISGNEAIALGAAASGLKFLAQYPITPASSILNYLANRARTFDIVVRQVEDELAAINMCIGASFAGARAMTASSGPGISLMAEGLGYAAMTETPVVIIDAMRAGPSTGIPTKTEQSDLSPIINISHGESPRAIFAPRSVEECFETTIKAFNIADRFQIPVIVLSDFSLSERIVNLKPFDLQNIEIDRGKIWEGPSEHFPTFKRYEFTKDGISPRSFPTTKNGEYILVGAEHDELSHSLSGNRCGHPLSWEIREKMFEKRFKKMELLRQEMNPPDLYGPTNSDYTIISWGSTKGAIQEAIERLNRTEKEKWNMLSFIDLFPLPFEKIDPFLTDIKRSIMYEVNYTGQLENLIHHHLNWRPDYRIHSLSGETPTPSSIIREIKETLKDKQEEGL